MSTVSTPQQIADALKLYADKMRDYIIGKLKQNYRSDRDWFEAYLNELGYQQKSNAIRTMEQRKEAGEEVNPEDVFDIVHVKNLLLGHRDIFQDDFGRSYQRVVTWSDEILDVRHKQAHQQDIAPNDLTRTMDSIVRILQAIGAEEEAAQLSDTVRTVVAPVRNTNNVSLQPWWRAAEPHRPHPARAVRRQHLLRRSLVTWWWSVLSEHQGAGGSFK
ncbi:MAG: Swt1 family HEPN domain-containing protein [Trueperaceae bacterium]|nr:Swt1 family HEPN domain-containing protein [Trueperaceae bacterium]